MSRVFRSATIVAVVLCAIAGCASSEPEAPRTFDVSGEFTLNQIAVQDRPGDACGGSGGYNDIVSDGSGFCVFPISVKDIPDKGTIFSIEVANRGEIPFKRADADSIEVSLG